MDSEAILYYANKPAHFVEDVIGVRPDPIQAEILQSLADNPRTTVRSGHGIGKSAVQSWAVLWFMCTRPFPKIPCTAPTQHQLHDILWAELAKWQRSNAALKSDLVWTQEKLYMRRHPEDWFAVPRTATQPDALQGFHAEHVLYIIDEASGVKDATFEPVLGALSTPGAKLLMCGNPTKLSGFFYDSHNTNLSMYEPFKVSSANSPRVSGEYVQMIIDMFGEDSDVYRVRVAGEFPKAMPDSFIAMEWAERNSVKHTSYSKAEHRIDFGVDVARFGDDESVICMVIDHKHVLPMEAHHHNDTMQLTGKVVQAIEAAKRNHPDKPIYVKIDCDGLGVGVYDRLVELNINGVTMQECHFGGKGGKLCHDDPVGFSNSTGLMWGEIRWLLKTDGITMPYDKKLIEQLSNRKYRVVSDGSIQLERKEEMKKRGVSSPDRGDALGLALYEPRSFATTAPAEDWGL